MKGKVLWLVLGFWLVVIVFMVVMAGTIIVFADSGGGGGSAENIWVIIGVILVPVLGVLGALCGVKWAQAIKALKEASEAVVALGMCGLKLSELLEKPGESTAEQIEQVLAQVRVVSKEFREAIEAAVALFRKTKAV